MTEISAIIRIRDRIDSASKVVGNGADGKAFEDLEMAIQAISDIQAYRAIGTVEDIQEVMALCKSLQETVCKYMDIGSVEECRVAVERMKPKKPIVLDRRFQNGDEVCTDWKCPVCGLNVIEEPPCQEYCQRCGNKLDWN